MDKINLVTIKNSKSNASEAFRTLRTNIQFSSIDEKVKVIVGTSPGPREGKSTIASNLAVVMGETGCKTVLVDCDMRKPMIHNIFQITNLMGISDFLASQCRYEEILKTTEIKNLYIITRGTKPPNPSELLASEKMHKFIDKLREEFDIVILDAPPMLMVSDAQVLSRYADGVLLVISSNDVNRDAAIKSKKLLEQVNAKILGVVLNKVKSSGRGYKKQYDYYFSSDAE
jgi:capsular exopolysaccharide synthesis family protein